MTTRKILRVSTWLPLFVIVAFSVIPGQSRRFGTGVVAADARVLECRRAYTATCQPPIASATNRPFVVSAGSNQDSTQPTVNPDFRGGVCAPPTPTLTELLLNPGFETMWGGWATDWIDNRWNGATLGYASAPGHAAGTAQKLTASGVTAGAGVIFAQRFTFQPGITYEGRILAAL